MHTKIYSDFWSDREIEPQGPQIKLAALWLMTNERVNLLGFAEVSEKRFMYDTGLPAEALTKTLEALTKPFVQFGKGSKIYWIRNYIRRQIGEGDSLLRNNMFKPLVRAWQGLRDEEVRALVLREYPEFNCAVPGGSPYQGLGASPEAQEQSREEKSRVEQSSIGGGAGEERGPAKGIPRGIDEVIATFAELGSTDEEAKNFFDHYTANGWKQGSGLHLKAWKYAASKWVRRVGKIRSGGLGPDVSFNPKQPNAHTGGMTEVVAT
jgi:hypothetical protein